MMCEFRRAVGPGGGPGGFGEFLVTLAVVTLESTTAARASTNSQSDKAGWAKMIFLGQTGSNEEASIRIIDVKTSVVYAYAVHKRNSVHGKQSSAEACAKHLKEVVR